MVEYKMMNLVGIRRILRTSFLILLGTVLLGRSVVAPGDQVQQVRALTRQIEFDFVSWTLDALRLKTRQMALGLGGYLGDERRRQIVLDYVELVSRVQRIEAQVEVIYGDPNIADPDMASVGMRMLLEDLYEQRRQLAYQAETVLQSQISEVVSDLGLSLGGQPVPPILYHSTPLPLALIVSPRAEIRQLTDISLIPDLTTEEKLALEEGVDRSVNVSSLVVPVGGVGTYPTMVQQTSDLPWLVEVIAHEWVHNYLTLRPLGLNYYTSPELRTMNETVASIAGKEIGLQLLRRFYPEFVPSEEPPDDSPPAQEEAPVDPTPPVFDFRAQMRETRLMVDHLLGEGKIVEAEEYMEQRRVFFWENGYRIRKLNQAYFAFYGAYADLPGGAAGEDPVGAAVRALRAQSPSLSSFVNRMSWIWSVKQLQQAVKGVSSWNGILSPGG
jgi:hypothetical protein